MRYILYFLVCFSLSMACTGQKGVALNLIVLVYNDNEGILILIDSENDNGEDYHLVKCNKYKMNVEHGCSDKVLAAECCAALLKGLPP